jgi:hypothetical protein
MSEWYDTKLVWTDIVLGDCNQYIQCHPTFHPIQALRAHTNDLKIGVNAILTIYKLIYCCTTSGAMCESITFGTCIYMADNWPGVPFSRVLHPKC